MVTWDDPLYKPCPIDEFRYWYEITNLDQCQVFDPPQLIDEGTTTNTFITLPDLETYSTYMIYVAGRNEAGDGETTSNISTTNSSSMYTIELYISLPTNLNVKV